MKKKKNTQLLPIYLADESSLMERQDTDNVTTVIGSFFSDIFDSSIAYFGEVLRENLFRQQSSTVLDTCRSGDCHKELRAN
jgi:hypothetical protein